MEAMVNEPSYCQAFHCLKPTENLRPDDEVLVHPVDRSSGPLKTKFDSPEVSGQVLRIHKLCFNSRDYVRARSTS